jgi:carboxymethylenebutenolidase
MDTVFTDPEERKRLMDPVGSLTKDEAARDAGAMLDFLAEQPEVAATLVGTTGYCMGGGLAPTAAGRHALRPA